MFLQHYRIYYAYRKLYYSWRGNIKFLINNFDWRTLTKSDCYLSNQFHSSLWGKHVSSSKLWRKHKLFWCLNVEDRLHDFNFLHNWLNSILKYEPTPFVQTLSSLMNHESRDLSQVEKKITTENFTKFSPKHSEIFSRFRIQDCKDSIKFMWNTQTFGLFQG